MEKYNEALEKAKEAYKNCATDAEKRRLESIFPELAESEDEKIKKEILEYISKATGCKEWIAWIEKQGESQENKLQVSDELYEHIRNTCACIDDALSSKTLADITDYLSMAERSANSALDMIEKQGEQKSAEWSEEDKGFVDLLLAIFTNEHPNGLFTTGDITVFNGNSVPSNRIVTWLKSLKFQKQWKPTEEQMQTLHAQLNEGAVTYQEDKRVLTTLYTDLLKL